MGSARDGPAIVVALDDAGCDLRIVDVIACLRLVARRTGATIRVRGGSDELRGLIAFCGLIDVLDVDP